jgi:zinc/manganese transport system substrate-binding protein
MKKLLLIPAISLIVSILLSALGCQTINTTAPSTDKSIVVTYSVMGALVKELVGSQARVTVSIPNGLDLHEWEPSAKDIEAINNADLIIRNGLGLEAGLEKTLDTAKERGSKMFTAADYITVRHVGPGEGIPSGDPDQDIGAEDPHLWTDPQAMRNVIGALENELMRELDINVSGQAAKLKSDLDALDKQIADMVKDIPEADRKLVTGHESMGYFAQRYGFKLIGLIIPSLSSQAQVSAADLADLKKSIQNNQVKVIFSEQGTSASVAETIGKETGAAVIELGTHIIPEDGSYFTFMKNLAQTIVNGLK